MASQPSLGPVWTEDSGPHIEQDSDPPQFPVIVPSSVEGNVSPSDPLAGEVPAVVSITRVPAKAKLPEAPPLGGLKVRTDLKPGPPPLLRVAGGPGSPRPALPPMPRLKLGGQRGGGQAGPRFPVNGMMNMMKGQQQSASPGLLNIPQPAMPSISSSLSLR